MLTNKKIEVDENAFRLLLFERVKIEADDTSELVKVCRPDDGADHIKMTRQKTVITIEELRASMD